MHLDSLADPDLAIGERLVAVLAAQAAERDPGLAHPHLLQLDRGDRERAGQVSSRPVWLGAVSGYPVLSAGVTIGPPVVCSSGRRRLPSAVPVTGDTSTTVGGTRSCRAAWSARHPVKVEVAGSNPVRTAGIPGEASLGSQLGQVAQLV